ncbi:hypothetical protein [Tunicatimonas pelagia]|uniref:hypothetical protein n=1 Tax=Tunicatimonas pelagia TaxID=931531 RepID=UPI002664EA85|nr:hypothetical protein [Tunicatimonas pelagia]WKN44308.1 hypothetical protein P0M28_04935 [Tunicatimonas pelagia]
MIRLCFLFFCIATIFLSCQEEEVVPDCVLYEPPADLDTYIYPVLPGTPEWVAIQTGAEKYAVTQVPDSVLQIISTEGLLETWLTYPLLENVLAWTTLQQGIDSVGEIFGGLQELQQRPDAGKVMLQRYKQMSPHCVNEFTTDIDIGKFTLELALYEAILAQNIFLQKLSVVEQDELLQLILSSYAIKEGYSNDLYSFFSLKATAIVAARLMVLADYSLFIEAMAQDDYLRVFVEQIELQGRAESITTVITYANNFIHQRN